MRLIMIIKSYSTPIPSPEGRARPPGNQRNWRAGRAPLLRRQPAIMVKMHNRRC